MSSNELYIRGETSPSEVRRAIINANRKIDWIIFDWRAWESWWSHPTTRMAARYTKETNSKAEELQSKLQIACEILHPRRVCISND